MGTICSAAIAIDEKNIKTSIKNNGNTEESCIALVVVVLLVVPYISTTGTVAHSYGK